MNVDRRSMSSSMPAIDANTAHRIGLVSLGLTVQPELLLEHPEFALDHVALLSEHTDSKQKQGHDREAQAEDCAVDGDLSV